MFHRVNSPTYSNFKAFKAMVAGAIPSSLNLEVAFLDHNLLGGPVPQRLLGGSEQTQKCVVAKALECPTCEQGQHATCLTPKKIAPKLEFQDKNYPGNGKPRNI
eukprot:6455182-Amphidinium_carterae.1